MQCPKCGHEQSDEVKCDSCGIYFKKFSQRQSRAKVSSSNADADGNRLGSIKAMVSAIVVVLGVAIYMSEHLDENPRTADASLSIPKAESSGAEVTDATPDVFEYGIAEQLAKTHPARNAIEAARNATVFIKTEWGSQGAGFFISSDCDVITNRHVVEMDPERISRAIQEQPEFRLRLAEKKMKMEFTIQQLKALHAQVAAKEGRSVRAIEINDKIELLQRELAELPQKIDHDVTTKVGDSLWAASTKGFTVILIDGTEFPATRAEYAPHADLAWFRLPTGHCPYIKPADSDDLQQGERLYTIGSPSGLAYTVTSGVFSGYREENQRRMLQTDAPINPGNSGGPLITERGEAVGINTSVARNTRGIGFAIPIETVYDEFPMVGKQFDE